MKYGVFSALFVAGGLVAGSALAGDATDATERCAAELDARGVAAQADYRPEFKRLRGGATKRVTVFMAPLSNENEPVLVECKIKGGEVIDVTVKA